MRCFSTVTCFSDQESRYFIFLGGKRDYGDCHQCLDCAGKTLYLYNFLLLCYNVTGRHPGSGPDGHLGRILYRASLLCMLDELVWLICLYGVIVVSNEFTSFLPSFTMHFKIKVICTWWWNTCPVGISATSWKTSTCLSIAEGSISRS